MKKAGIVIDTWKLQTFARHLAKAGYEFTEGAGLANGTMTLYVGTEDLKALEQIVRAANEEAAATKAKLNPGAAWPFPSGKRTNT